MTGVTGRKRENRRRSRCLLGLPTQYVIGALPDVGHRQLYVDQPVVRHSPGFVRRGHRQGAAHSLGEVAPHRIREAADADGARFRAAVVQLWVVPFEHQIQRTWPERLGEGVNEVRVRVTAELAPVSGVPDEQGQRIVSRAVLDVVDAVDGPRSLRLYRQRHVGVARCDDHAAVADAGGGRLDVLVGGCQRLRRHTWASGGPPNNVTGVCQELARTAGTAAIDKAGLDSAGMVFLVPFDGSPLADAALERAVTYAGALGTDVVAVSLIPTGSDYAQRRRRVDPTEDFAAETAASDLRRKIEEATDTAELNYEDVSAYSANELSDTIRQVARDVDATCVFLGSADTDDVVIPSSELDDEDAYDVHIVRRVS